MAKEGSRRNALFQRALNWFPPKEERLLFVRLMTIGDRTPRSHARQKIEVRKSVSGGRCQGGNQFCDRNRFGHRSYSPFAAG